MTISTDSDFDPMRLMTMMARNGHNGFLGVEYHAHGADWCELALPYNAALQRQQSWHRGRS
jgi:hypothetical protein